MNQKEIAERNRIAWETNSYEAWTLAYGSPQAVADELVKNPKHKLRRILPYLNTINGQRIANPLGSHGRLAVSLALLGAEVSILDISASNQRYALELAESAKVQIQYEIGDFIQTSKKYTNQFDQVIMELGVVHYFIDLEEFAGCVGSILKLGGRMILNEFHPIMKKSIKSEGDKIVLNGNYFTEEVEVADTPYKIFLKENDIPNCMIRRWNLGEIVTAFAEKEFRIEKLVEEPSWDIRELPGTFTLVASR